MVGITAVFNSVYGLRCGWGFASWARKISSISSVTDSRLSVIIVNNDCFKIVVWIGDAKVVVVVLICWIWELMQLI